MSRTVDVTIANPYLHPDLLIYPPAGARLVSGHGLTAYAQDVRLGAGAYTGQTLTALGRSIAFADSVGSDLFGTWTLERLGGIGADLTALEVYEGDTMVVVSLVDDESQGATMLITCPPEWQRSLDDFERVLRAAPSSRVLYLWSWYWSYSHPRLADAATRRIVDVARERTECVVLDPNWKPAGAPPAGEVRELVAALPRIDLVKLSQNDARVLVGTDEPVAVVRRLREWGAHDVVLTRSDDGCSVAAEGESTLTHIPTPPTRLRDSTGAGDIFGGSLVDRLLDGAPLTSAARFATASASLAIGRARDEPFASAERIEQLASTLTIETEHL